MSRWPWSAWWSTSASRTPNGCPNRPERQAEIEGITLPRLAVAAGADALPLVLAYLQSTGGPG